MKPYLPISILLLSLSTSCSHFSQSSKPEKVEISQVQMEDMNRQALAIASERLGKMVHQAKNNPGSAQFLASDLFLKANMSLLEGDYTTASVLFGHLIVLVPDDEFVQKKYAISLIRTGDIEASKPVLEKLYTQTKNEKVGLILAGVYTGLDLEKEARVVYQSILKLNPKNEDACVFLGKSYAIEKQMTKAFSLLNGCASQDKTNGMFDYYIGKIYVDMGNIPKAIASFKKAYVKQPKLGQAVSALGLIYEESENSDEAVKLYTTHLKTQPNDSSILTRIVQLLFVKEKFQEVIPYAERLSDIEPDNLNLKVKLGILYTDAKKYPEAVSVFRDLLTSAPQSDKILYYLGAIYQEMKRFPESIEYFNQIPTESGLYTDSSVQMANMLSSLAQAEYFQKDGKNWEGKFLKHVNGKLAELKDLKVEFSVIKSGFFESVGQYHEAMETMKVVQNEKSFSTQHVYYLANLFEKEQKFAEATSLIMGLIEREPKNAHAWNFLGYSLLVRGEEMDKAFEYIQTALKISPDDGYIRDSLGWYYYKKGEIKKALAELESAYKKVPDDIEILKHLAHVHKEIKDFAKAKSYYETALKHARYHSDKQEILTYLESIEGLRVPASGKLD